MESCFRLADAVNSMIPQELIMILAVKWFRLSLSVVVFCLFLECSFIGSAQDCHTTLGS